MSLEIPGKDKGRKHNEALETTPESGHEGLEDNISSAAEIDLNNSSKSTNHFVAAEKARLGVLEDTPALESEIKQTLDKHESRRKRLLSAFMSKVKKVAKYTAGGVTALAFTAHFAKQEYPDHLSKDTEPPPIEWNESTRADLEQLAHEYALLIKSEKGEFANIPDSIFENRFMDFVTTYGPDIQIIHPGDDMDWDDKMYNDIFEGVLKQPAGKAHDALGGTLFFEDKTLKKYSEEYGDTTKYDWETTSLVDFSAEFAHHINNDWSLRRAFAYADDLASQGFKQGGMYGDPYSSEFQAHSVTQHAIHDYLFPGAKELSVPFEDMYNLHQDYYRKFVNTRGYERDEDIEEISWIFYTMNFSQLQINKGAVFKNLDFIRDGIDGLEISDESKGDLFGLMVTTTPLQNPDNTYEVFLTEAKGFAKILETKRLFMDNKTSLRGFIEELQNRYSTDAGYLYASLTEEIIDYNLYYKVRYESKDFSREDVCKFFELYTYGIAKSIEGKGLGHQTTLDEGDFDSASRDYESYLVSSIKSLGEDSSDEAKDAKIKKEILDKMTHLELNRYLISTLSSYIEGSKVLVNEYANEFQKRTKNWSENWQRNLIIRLQEGINSHEKPDLERDFFENGESPLEKIKE